MYLATLKKQKYRYIAICINNKLIRYIKKFTTKQKLYNVCMWYMPKVS